MNCWGGQGVVRLDDSVGDGRHLPMTCKLERLSSTHVIGLAGPVARIEPEVITENVFAYDPLGKVS